MLLKRVITAVVLLAILFASLSANTSLYFQLLLLVFGTLAVWEWNRLMNLSSAKAALLAGLTAAAGVALLTYGGAKAVLALLGAATIVWVLVVLPSLRSQVLPRSEIDSQNIFFGVILIPAAILAANHIWTAFGAITLVSLLAIVFIADIAAYFVGKSIGKHKLAPTISPGKTWEGAIGGAAAVLVYGAICIFASAKVLQQTYPYVVSQKWGVIGALAVLALLAVFSVVGDLYESLLKRRAGVKDSSQLLPGHGGVLDRLDAQLPVLPIAVLLVWGVR
jgi:phosphatidate cytidylyltransferase